MPELNTETGSTGNEPVTINIPKDAPANISPREAGRILASQRHRREEPVAPVEAAPAPVESEAAPVAVDDSAPPETEAPAETQEAEPAEVPPIEPPRSWTKAEKERFSTLPRETQEYLAEREQERDREFRRSQNDAAEKLKGLTAKEQAAEQARQNYEAALPQVFETLRSTQQGQFADIQTIADVEKLASEDWPRYLQWDVAQKKMAAVQQQMLAAQERQQQEKSQKFTDFAKAEDARFLERVPEMADADKAARLQKQALSVLKDIGFTEAELGSSWTGQGDLSLRDHRIQLLIRDATLYREAQAKAKIATAKPAPSVQRPGTPQGKSAGGEAEIQALQKQLDNASGVTALRLATRLQEAKRAAAR